MLGLASAVSTASIHEQRYSLSLDGAGDYLIVRNGFNRASRTFSAWFNSAQNTVTQSYGNVILSQTTSGGDNRWHARIDPATNLVKLYDGAAVTVDSDAETTISLNRWYHLIVTEDGSTVKYYINGELEGSDNVAIGTGDSDLFTVGQEFDGSSSSDHFKGLIGDVAAWGVVLDAAAALDVYNAGSPFDLNTDRGAYDNASNLIGYWKMGYGSFDDKANGVVHDQTDPGFGINLWDGANGDVTNWTPFGNNTVEEDDGTLKFTYVDNVSGPYIYLRDAHHLSADLVVGATYELSITTKVNTGSVTWRLQHNSYPTYTFSTLTSTDFVTQSVTFIATTVNSHYLFAGAFGAEEIVWVKDITVRKLNGNPGLTSGGPTFSSDTP